MKICHEIKKDEVVFYIPSDAGSRSRYVKWQASSADGRSNDDGIIDISNMQNGEAVRVRLGFEAVSVKVVPIRDSTPGVHQSQCSSVPAGSCELTLRCTCGFTSPIEVYLSRTGNPDDSTPVWTIRGAKSGQNISIPVISRESWSRMFIKKGDHVKEEIAFDTIKLKHISSGSKFESLAHIIKPEHVFCKKDGKTGIRFLDQAPAYYAYFSIGFQKE